MSHDFRIGGILISTVVPALILGLIVSVLPVPPPHVRPSVEMDG